MFTMDVDTLTVLQRERYSEFQRQAELLRLLRGQKETDTLPCSPALTGREQRNLFTDLQQMVWTALQTHLRAVPPR